MSGGLAPPSGRASQLLTQGISKCDRVQSYTSVMGPPSFGYTIDLTHLRNLQAYLNSPEVVSQVGLDGLFWRVEDFSQSHAQLNMLFHDELKVAHDAFPRSNTADELHSNVASRIRLNSSGVNSFNSYALSPAVRHFINDSCRLLEPFTVLLASKQPTVSLRRNESLSTYVEKLKTADVDLNFNDVYLLELYEVWNDYKHRNTRGTHTTSWKFESNQVSKPILRTPQLNRPLIELRDIEVDSFVNKTTEVILDFCTDILR